MFSENKASSGKHMICDIKNIRNIELLSNITKVKYILDNICNKYNFTILNKIEYVFQPQGFTILYLLSESHISIHTFPERNYFALDIYTCREYTHNKDYEEIYKYLVNEFEAKEEIPFILDRMF